MMTTLQSGGIPGEVIGGVPMVGSHGRMSLDMEGSLPDHVLPIYGLGDGTIFGLDFSASVGREAPVVSWHGDPQAGTETAASDFGTFLFQVLKSAAPGG